MDCRRRARKKGVDADSGQPEKRFDDEAIKKQQTELDALKKFVCSKEPDAELCRLN